MMSQVIHLPAGDYLRSGIVLPPGGMLCGAGPGRTRVIYNGPAGRRSVISGHGDGIKVQDLTIDCGAIQPESTVVGVSLHGDRCVIRNVEIVGAYDNGAGEGWAAIISAPEGRDMQHSEIIDCTARGFRTGYTCGFYVAMWPNSAVYRYGAGVIRGCLVEGNPWVAYSLNAGRLEHCAAIGCGFGYRVDTGLIRDLTIRANRFLGCTAHGIQLLQDGWDGMPAMESIKREISDGLTICDNEISIAPHPTGREWGSRAILLDVTRKINREVRRVSIHGNTLRHLGAATPDEYGIACIHPRISGTVRDNVSDRPHWLTGSGLTTSTPPASPLPVLKPEPLIPGTGPEIQLTRSTKGRKAILTATCQGKIRQLTTFPL